MEVGKCFNPNQWFYGAFIPNVLLRNPHISPIAKLLYARLAEYYHGKSESCYPSQSQLANQLGVSVPTIIKATKELEGMTQDDSGKWVATKEAFIEVTRPTGEDHLKHFHNNYKFLWHSSFEDADSDKDIRNPIVGFEAIPGLNPCLVPGLNPCLVPNKDKVVKKKNRFIREEPFSSSNPIEKTLKSNPKPKSDERDPLEGRPKEIPTFCPKCEDQLVEKNGSHGQFWGCVNYPKCTYTI